MYKTFCILLLSFYSVAWAFFLLGENEPVLFCIKICPLYCSPRRHDEDASSLIYVDEPPSFTPFEHWHDEEPYYFDPYYFCKPFKPKPTTTTPAPTTMKTTTEEPSGICMFCKKKCTRYPKS